MIHYSYPFNNLNIEEFWSCFENLESIEIMDIKSNSLINNKFLKAKVYYYKGTFVKKWQNLNPNNKEYVFQIGEHENCHGHFFNIDMTYFLHDLKLNIPFQISHYWAAPDSIAENRIKTVHLPTIPYDSKDCWEVLWNMIKGLRQFDGKNLASMEMHKFWDVKNMHWVGPECIGHLHGLAEFQEFHQRKFLKFIPDRDGSKGINKVIFSQGNYAALMGCYSMTATHQGEYFGFLPEEGSQVKPFVMDFWTCDGNRLVDNWCQIDMVDLWRSINKEFKSYIDAQFGI